MFDNQINGNPSSAFLCGVNEIDIIEIVRKCKNKTSADINCIDMVIIKVTDSIVRPLTYIYVICLSKKVFFQII